MLKMRTTLCGLAGTGKTTLGKRIALYAGTNFVSVGTFQRQTAREYGLTLEQFLDRAKADSSFDRKTDERTRAYGRKNDEFVMEGRLAYRFVEGAFNVLLICSPEECARRIAGREGIDQSIALKKVMARNAADRERFRTFYGIERFDDIYNFHFVIDTTHLDELGVVDEFFRLYHEYLKLRAEL